MQHFVKQKQKHAGSSERVMDAGDHSKNGASPKSHTSRGNFKLFAVFLLVAAGIIAVKSCKKDPDDKVSKKVIELVTEPEVFAEKPEFERTEEKIKGSEST